MPIPRGEAFLSRLYLCCTQLPVISKRKEARNSADRLGHVTEASDHSSTAIAAQIATNVSWMKLWDMTLDHGSHGTDCLQALYRELTRPQFQKGVCHHCGIAFHGPYFHHYTPADVGVPSVARALRAGPEGLIQRGRRASASHLFRPERNLIRWCE